MTAFERLRHDLRYAIRALARSPGFAAVAVLTLGLGIGANTAIYSVVHAVVRKPLPYAEPQRLVRFYTTFEKGGFDRFWSAPHEYHDFERELRSFSAIGAWSVAGTNIAAGETPLRINTAYVSRELFDVLGVRPALGRTPSAAEDVENGPHSIVLSDTLSRRLFGDPHHALGKTVVASGASAEVVGVMPPGFSFPPDLTEPAEAWLPLQLPVNPEPRANHYLHVIGRLAPGSNLDQARAEATAFAARDAQSGKRHTFRSDHGIVLYAFHDEVVRAVRPALFVLLAAVALVLLIACVNVGNLLLARAEMRQREIALRAALGADTRRLFEQFVVEGLLLAGAGAVLGILLALPGVRALVAFRPEGLPRIDEIAIDLPVLLFTVAISVAASVVFALAPLGYTRGLRLAEQLRQAGQRVAGTARGRLVRRSLVVTEIALTVVLVIGAGLMIRSFDKLLDVDPGFRPGQLLTMQLDLTGPSYRDPARFRAFWDRFLERARALPGVSGAALAYAIPPQRPTEVADLEIEGLTRDPNGPPIATDYLQIVGPGYFEVLGLPLLAGRTFDASDRAPNAPVAIVNQAFARRFLPGQNAIGKRIKLYDQPWTTIIGVARDVPNGGLDQPVKTEVYFEADQLLAQGVLNNEGPLYAVVRAPGEPRALAAPLRAIAHELDPLVPLFKVRSMDEVIASSIARPRLLALLLSLFSVLALAMAAIGVYGVVAYQVAQRRQELGIRMALGAPRSNVFRLVLASGLRLALAGVATGMVCALALARVVAGLIYGISPSDPATYAGVALLLVVITLFASYVPAAAATRVDPLIALRAE